MRHRARRDANEGEIVATLDALRLAYRRVNCPRIGDLEVILRGRPWFVEVKVGDAAYTRAQQDRRDWLRLNGVDVDRHCPTWRRLEDVFDFVETW